MPPDTDGETGAAEDVEKTSATGGPVAAFAAAIRQLHRKERRGDLAELRRLDPRELPGPSAFQKLLFRHMPTTGPEQARRVALLLKILALPTRPDAIEDGWNKLGLRLKEARVSEARVQRLLAARGPALDDQVLRVARRLAASGRLPFFELGRLVLGSAADAERIRFDIARGFWTERAPSDADAPIDTEHPVGETE